MHKSAAEAIFAGTKTIETRFSKHKIAPFGVVSQGDIVYMKLPGEDIVGQFKVKKVFSYEGLVPEDIEKIFQDFGKQISMGNKDEDEEFKKSKVESSFGTLIFISESERFITSPIKIKKNDMRGWMVLE